MRNHNRVPVTPMSDVQPAGFRTCNSFTYNVAHNNLFSEMRCWWIFVTWFVLLAYAALFFLYKTGNQVPKASNQIDRLTCTTISEKSSCNQSDFMNRDLVKENDNVDAVSPLLTSHIDVIRHAQGIHLNIFSKLFSKVKYAMIFPLFISQNKGDSAISAGELSILDKFGIKLVYYCVFPMCLHEELQTALNISRAYKSSELVILLQGGGTLICYPNSVMIHVRVLRLFNRFKVVIFPQSFWTRNDSQGTRLQAFKPVYNSHPRLTIIFRDRTSYENGRRFFHNAQSLLAPDIAFQLGPKYRNMLPTHDIVWLQRTDIDSTNYSVPARAKDFDILFGDWINWKTTLGTSPLENMHLEYANGLTYLQRGKVVITDRLHGHILSVLQGLPHVVMDPSSHKLLYYLRTWTAGLPNVVVATSPDDALDKAVKLLHELH